MSDKTKEPVRKRTRIDVLPETVKKFHALAKADGRTTSAYFERLIDKQKLPE